MSSDNSRAFKNSQAPALISDFVDSKSTIHGYAGPTKVNLGLDQAAHLAALITKKSEKSEVRNLGAPAAVNGCRDSLGYPSSTPWPPLFTLGARHNFSTKSVAEAGIWGSFDSNIAFISINNTYLASLWRTHNHK